MLKQIFKFLLQKLLGFKRYLLLFSIYSVNKALNGKYEPALDAFIRLVPDNHVILDIGANIGITMVPIARAKRNATIIGYEPILENFKTAKKILKIYNIRNAQIHNYALSDHPGILKMVMPVINGAKQQGLSKVYRNSEDREGICYTVNAYKLDDLFDKEKISAIKIDVENFEYEVLKGASKLLKKFQPMVYCELWKNEKREKVFEFMHLLGYQIHIFDETTGSLKTVPPEYDGTCSNFIFIAVAANSISIGQY